MRFDAEVDGGLPYSDRIAQLFRLLEFDFIDLLYNGDMNNTSDALYHSMDGINALKKKGKKFTKFEVASAQLHEEYRPNKKLYEYTLYCVLYVGSKDVPDSKT